MKEPILSESAPDLRIDAYFVQIDVFCVGERRNIYLLSYCLKINQR